ncbi:MAG: 3D domain-containing protein [Candidatus Portnoybacteria bacterium]|nr:3D domain-containing protein [Candidatus Portnoybacteria bacterium]
MDTGFAGVDQTKRVIVTAYSSTPDQTDSSPFITAKGTFVRDGIVACNFLAFGTKVRFPEMYGDKIFVVEDRMAKKNSHKIDIWMESRNEALQFGVRTLAVEILN